MAFLDKRLTEKWLNSYDVAAHCICLDDVAEQSSSKDLENFLGAEYGKSLRWVNVSKVGYLGSLNYTPFGVFAKSDINHRDEIPGSYWIPGPDRKLLRVITTFPSFRS